MARSSFFFVIAVSLTSACGSNGEMDSNEVVEITLSSVNSNRDDDDVQFQLQVPESYLRAYVSSDDLEVRCIYPSMEGFSAEKRSDFYEPTGAPTDNVIRIFVTHFVNEWFSKNNSGNHFLETVILQNLQRFRLTDQSEISNGIVLTRYAVGATDIPSVDVLHFADGRAAVLTCDGPTCKGRTTWHGRLAIMYYISDSLRNKFLEVDGKVIELIQSFNPEEKSKN